MGYRTSICLAIYDTDDETVKEQIIKELLALNGYQLWPLAINGESFGDKMLWTYLEATMLVISERHQNLLFVVQGQGDDDNDKWQNTYKNGQSSHWNAQDFQYPTAIDPTVNEKQLSVDEFLIGVYNDTASPDQLKNYSPATLADFILKVFDKGILSDYLCVKN